MGIWILPCRLLFPFFKYLFIEYVCFHFYLSKVCFKPMLLSMKISVTRMLLQYTE